MNNIFLPSSSSAQAIQDRWADKSLHERAAQLARKVGEKFIQAIPSVIGNIGLGLEITGNVVPVVQSTSNFVDTLIKKNPIDSAQATSQVYNQVMDSFNKVTSKIGEVFKFIGDYKIIQIIASPFAVLDLAMKIKKFVRGILKKSPATVMADKTLAMINSAIDITGLVASFVGNAVFGTVAGFLSAINIVIRGKKLYHNVYLYKDTIKTKNSGDNPLKGVSKRHLKNHLEAKNPKEMRKKVDAIWSNANTTPAVKNEILNATKRRSIQKIVSDVLKITASVINIVATVILLVYPPLAPVALGLYALSSLITLADYITEKIVSWQWERAINKNHGLLFPPAPEQKEKPDDIELQPIEVN